MAHSPARLPEVFTPMLATLEREPFDSEDHLFEIKWDGVRVLAFCEPGETRLYSRSGREMTGQYPEFADLHERLAGTTHAVLDGEIVAMNEQGRPSFGLLQKRIGLTKPHDVRRAVEKVPVDLLLFDHVFDGSWLGEVDLVTRRESLSRSVVFSGDVQLSDAIAMKGIALFEAAQERGLEGIVGKRTSSRYHPGKRTRDWLKIKVVRTVKVVIGGISPGEGNRASTFGSLVTGAYDPEGNLVYVGNVGTGFTDRKLKELQALLADLQTQACPFQVPPPIKAARWVQPELIAQVELRELTSDLKLRAPSFKRLVEGDPTRVRLEDL